MTRRDPEGGAAPRTAPPSPRPVERPPVFHVFAEMYARTARERRPPSVAELQPDAA